MKWFNNWFAKKCEEAWENHNNNQINSISKHNRLNVSELSSRGMNFTVYNGVGGYVVEIRRYNVKADIHDNVLHIIPSDKDLGESLNHIITYELLKQ